jgi:hypothetical protein
MNKVNIFDDYTGSYKSVNLDSFPNFPGFPKHISGGSFEGFIYCNMDSDPELEVVGNIGYTVQAFNIDGSSVPGWPKTLTSYAGEGAPAFGDIDGDGQEEIVATNHGLTSGGYIFAFKKNGTPVTGFPINHGYSTRTPVLADIDNDGKMEIIVNKRIYPVGEVWVYRGTGVVFPGWPKAINHVPASSAAVGDIDGDNIPEIIAESYIALYAWKSNGDSIPGFPFILPNSAVTSYSSPVLADLDGDNKREIIFGTHVSGAGGYLFVLKYDGSQLTGFPKATGNWIYGAPSVGYIDGDTLLDIAVGDQVLSGTPADYVYGWNKNGDVLSGFPIGPLNAVNTQILLGDIDNDNSPELIFDDNSSQAGLGQYLAYNHNGTPVTGWPINTTGTTFFNNPCLTDLNRDGILDIIGAGTEGTGSSAYTNVYLWNTGKNYNPNKITLPVFQYNVAHSGVYGKQTLVGVSNNVTELPKNFELYQNYPNPFNPTTTIKFNVTTCHSCEGRNPDIVLKVFNILGREVATLVNEKLAPGTYTVDWNASQYPSGVYFYRLQTNGFAETRKMLLTK